MKKLLKLIFAAAALFACFAPYELKREENGDFSYVAWFFGLTRKSREDGEKEYTVSLLNLPSLHRCGAKAPAAEAEDPAVE